MENNKMVKMSKVLDVLTNIFQKVSIVLCGVCVIALILMGTKKDWIPARILDVDIEDMFSWSDSFWRVFFKSPTFNFL